MIVTARPHALVRPLLLLLITTALLVAATITLPTSAGATGLDTPVGQEIVLPLTPADEGGGGLGNAGESEWIMFAVALGPFLVLIIGLLWLTLKIDSSEDNA